MTVKKLKAIVTLRLSAYCLCILTFFLLSAAHAAPVLQPFEESLATNGLLPPMIVEIGSMILHGANGNPLSRRLTEGNEHSAWVAGDWGVMNTNAHGREGLGEVGFYQSMCYHVQAGLGFGKTKGTQHLDLGGKATLDGNYFVGHVMGELPIPIPDLWVTASAFYFWGNFEARRGYINADMPVTSQGKPHASMPAARLRIDWDEILCCGAMSLSPYVEGSFMHINIDDYTETGGGFPATFNVRKEKIPEARVGVQSRSPVWQCTDLLARIEGVHRFTKEGVITTGQLLDVISFSLPGKTYNQNWLRASLGVEQKIGQGLASLAVNATTPGQEARMWIAASYNLQF